MKLAILTTIKCKTQLLKHLLGLFFQLLSANHNIFNIFTKVSLWDKKQECVTMILIN